MTTRAPAGAGDRWRCTYPDGCREHRWNAGL